MKLFRPFLGWQQGEVFALNWGHKAKRDLWSRQNPTQTCRNVAIARSPVLQEPSTHLPEVIHFRERLEKIRSAATVVLGEEAKKVRNGSRRFFWGPRLAHQRQDTIGFSHFDFCRLGNIFDFCDRLFDALGIFWREHHHALEFGMTQIAKIEMNAKGLSPMRLHQSIQKPTSLHRTRPRKTIR